MKKFILILAALAVAFSASAQVVFGTYNRTTDVFTASGLDNIGSPEYATLGFPSVNPSCLSFAIQVADPYLMDALDKDERYVVAFAAVRNGELPADHFENNAIRMVKAPGNDYVFWVERFDLGTLGAGSDAPHIHSQIIVASSNEANDAGFEFWWEDNTAAFGWTPTYMYLGQYDVTNTTCAPYTALPTNPTTGEDCNATGWFNTLGQKLNNAPASGAYIETYDNCPAQKFVK